MHGSARRLGAYAVVALLLAAGAGCSRKFFRNRADQDVAGIITQKNQFPDWAVKNWHVYPDPRSRFADPYNPDRPPYPPDDAAARLLSPNPQHPTKKTGTGRWDGDGYFPILEQWDAANRAEDAPAARGAPPGASDRVILPRPPYMDAKKPTNAVVPASAAVAGTPVVPPATTKPVATENAEWVGVKPIVILDPAVVGPPAPAVTEMRTPVINLVGSSTGEKPELLLAIVVPATPVLQPPVVLPDPPSANPLPVLPALPSIPIPAPQPPEILPEPTPVPKAVEPKTPSERPAVPNAVKTPGELPSLETPTSTGGTASDYLQALAGNQQGYRIKLDQAIELGLINSREFQDRREDLYLAALPVTLERYNFAAQAFFTEQAILQSTGSQLSDAGRMWTLNTTGGFSRRFASGGSLFVQLANQVVIDLSSNRPDIAVSNFSLSFLQPFLRGGGFAVNLEALTAVERNLLYGMRSYARFRKVFYVAVAAGGNITNNPYGLQGLSANLGRGIGGNLTAPSVGFLPLLQQSAIVTNQRKNVTALEQILRLYQAFEEAGQIAPLQTGQVEVQLLNSRAALLNGGGGTGLRAFLDALDNYKLQLGLPVTVGLDLDNTPLKPIRTQLANFEDVYADARVTEEAANQYNPQEPPEQFRARWKSLLTDSELSRGTAFAKGIVARWDVWAKLTDDGLTARVTAIKAERNKLLDQKADRKKANAPEPEAEARKLMGLDAELDLAAFERAVRTYEAKPWDKLIGPARIAGQASTYREVSYSYFKLVLDARSERLSGTEKQWPKLPGLPVNGVDLLEANLDDAYTSGIQAALNARLDLMNARGQVVDAYRQIAVQANSLQGVFTIGYDNTGSTPAGGNTPFAFSGNRSTNRLTINAELPLVRRAERNNYRASLIGYQRQRRTLMAFEDNIVNDVRNDIREARTLAALYRIQQRVVELGYSQVDNARETQFQPLAANVTQDAAASAALTQQLLQAQSNLLNAQNQLYTLWVSYITSRMSLYLDLELLQLDDRGVWIDEQITGTSDLPRPGPERQPAERLAVPRPVAPDDRK